ncbi:DedA family protein [Lysobacter korlensis]|uniref:DedA family protein n=1 Tax=Lysobacter korlensis TaxID=553636 RepID=A0ABV6RN97_9GAMM
MILELLVAAGSEEKQLPGILGFATRIIQALSEWGVGLLTLIETVFPPIPSEVILPLAGFLSNRGDMNIVLVFVTATVGGYLGALLLYWLGSVYGEERTIDTLSRIPLLDRNDFQRAAGWLHRHGRRAVFFGRLIPGVRSLISLPAGATRMPLGTFTVFTLAGTALWNALLIGLGAALGSQYEQIDRYSGILDAIIMGVLVVLFGMLVVRRIKRGRAAKAGARREDPPQT